MIPMHENLRGKVAVITGGSGVLCSEMARELGRQGVKVAVLARNTDKTEAVAHSIRQAGGQAVAVSCDVTDPESVKRAGEIVREQLGNCQILINGAGGNHPDGTTAQETFQPDEPGGPGNGTFFDMKETGFGTVFGLNFMGTFLTTQIFARQMIPGKGVVINLSSMSAAKPLTKVPAYSAAKAAIDNFTQWLAVHLADAGIRVNAIAPGFFLTEQNRTLLLREDGSLTERSGKIISHTPLRRFGTPQDLLGTLLWLADDSMSGFVTGITVPVDGGFNAYSGV